VVLEDIKYTKLVKYSILNTAHLYVHTRNVFADPSSPVPKLFLLFLIKEYSNLGTARRPVKLLEEESI